MKGAGDILNTKWVFKTTDPKKHGVNCDLLTQARPPREYLPPSAIEPNLPGNYHNLISLHSVLLAHQLNHRLPTHVETHQQFIYQSEKFAPTGENHALKDIRNLFDQVIPQLPRRRGNLLRRERK